MRCSQQIRYTFTDLFIIMICSTNAPLYRVGCLRLWVRRFENGTETYEIPLIVDFFITSQCRYWSWSYYLF